MGVRASNYIIDQTLSYLDSFLLDVSVVQDLALFQRIINNIFYNNRFMNAIFSLQTPTVY